MKFFLFILSFLLFAQSMVLCSGSLHRLSSMLDNIFVNHEYACGSLTVRPSKSCCSADTSSACQNDSPSSDSGNNCCGDDCRCFCSIKVFNQRLHFFRLSEETDEKYDSQVNFICNMHSFDYHPSISYPPQS